MELFASFWIRSEVLEVVRQEKRSHLDGKGAEVVGMKDGKMKIQDSAFVKVIEKLIQIFEIVRSYHKEQVTDGPFGSREDLMPASADILHPKKKASQKAAISIFMS